VAAEVPGADGDHATERRCRRSHDLVAMPSGTPGRQVEHHREGIAGGVDNGHASRALLGQPAEVGEACGCRWSGKQQPDADEPSSCETAPPRRGEVEHGRRGPTSDRQVAEQRVEGVPEPVAA
jgi:hypothetical protein